MQEKATRIFGVSCDESQLKIIGDLYIKGDLFMDNEADEIVITGHLWVDGDVFVESDIEAKTITISGDCIAEGCSLTAEGIEITGSCQVEELTSKEGDVIVLGAYTDIATITSAKDVVIGSKNTIENVIATEDGNGVCAEITEIVAIGDVTIQDCYCNHIRADGDVSILSSICPLDAVKYDSTTIADRKSRNEKIVATYIYGANIYGRQVMSDKLFVKDTIYLIRKPKAFWYDGQPVMVAKEIIIEEN